MDRKSANLPRPTIWLFPISDRQFDKDLSLLRNDEEFKTACQVILQSISPSFFTPYGDRDVALSVASENLSRLAQAVVRGAGPDRATYMRAAKDGTHKSWKQIAELPKRIERMARVISQVNGGPFFTRLEWAFRDLPTHMERYAEALRQKTTFKTAFGYKRPMQYLLETVKEYTGHDRPSAVARLLQAAGEAIGLRATYTAQSVRDARRDRRNETRRA